jgi:GntR family transcriptional repressor for pyruvate dehydrogenase complex
MPRHGLPIVYEIPTIGLDGALYDPHPKRASKISEVIAADLVRDIVVGDFLIGNHLPPEAAMLEQYGVGRESLREALRLLEAQGLITIKRGPGGGPVVAGVDPRYLARTSALYFHLSGATYDEVMETWQVLESAVAAKVAGLHNRTEVRRALAPHLRLPSSGVERDEFITGAGFHSTLAQLSGSRVLVLLLRAVSHMVVEHVAEALTPLEEWETVESEHDAIAQAIFDGRPSKSHRLMNEHIGHIRDSCQRRWPERLLELVEWR